MNIRKFVVRATHLDDLVQLGTLTAQAARFLEAAVASGLNILVAGGTQAGNPILRQYTGTASTGADAECSRERPSAYEFGASST